MITIDGKKYKVTENLGFVHSRGVYAKAIMVKGKEQIAIKVDKEWQIAKPVMGTIMSNYTGQHHATGKGER